MSGRPIALRPRQGWLLLAATAFLALALLGPALSQMGLERSTGEGSLTRQLGYVSIFALALIAVRPMRAPMRLLVMPTSLVLALAWCWISLAWAIAPGVALRRLLLTTMVIWTIFLTVDHLGFDATLKTIRAALVGVLVANFAAVALWPSVGIHLTDVTGDPGLVGDWRGVTTHKNFAGAVSAFTVLLFTLESGGISRWLRLATIAASGFFLVMSGSKTSMGILMVAMGCGLAYRFYRPHHRVWLAPAFTVAGVAAFVAIQSSWERLQAAMDNPYALTGRAQIWPVMTDFISDHWLLGSGYGSFWNIGAASPVYRYGSGWVSELASGHNGYLDALAQVGVPGLTLIVWAMLLLPTARLIFTRRISSAHGSLLLALIVFCAGHNLTESSLLDRDSFVQVMLLYAIALIAPAAAPPAPPLPFPEDRRVVA